MICRRSSTRRVCGLCIAHVDADLTAIPALYEALGEMLEPSWGMRTDARVSGGGRVGSPVPVRLEPLSLRAHGGIVSVLHYWESDWRMVLGWTARPFRGTVQQSVVGAVTFLRNNWTWAADEHAEADAFAANIREWAAACRVQVNGPGESRMIGMCPQTADDGMVCGTSLWADPYAQKIQCRGCRTMWPRHAWIELGRRMRMTSQADPLDNANVDAVV
jgi:hypothetical protein